MTDKEIITEYREIVFEYAYNRERMVWNQNHGLPLLRIPERLRELKDMILRFDDIMDTIPDRRARNILRGRYALGMSIRNIAAGMDLSAVYVRKICDTALSMLQ